MREDRVFIGGGLQYSGRGRGAVERVWYFKREARVMEEIKRLGCRGISCNCEIDVPFSVGAYTASQSGAYLWQG